jgi:hypothetical protein
LRHLFSIILLYCEVSDPDALWLRHLFAIILLYCEVSDPDALWLRHRDALSEDIIYKLKNNGMHNHVNLDYVYYFCLKEIDTVLQDNNSSLIVVSKIDIKAYELLSGVQIELPFTFDEDRSLNLQELKVKVFQTESSLNVNQRTVYNDILIELNNISR